MHRTARQALIDAAGALAALERERTALRREHARLDAKLAKLDVKIAEAARRVDACFARLKSVAAGNGDPAAATGPLAPGKLPHRLLEHMRAHPERLATAPELARDLAVGDVQQVRTALARLEKKRLIRRTDVKGVYAV